MGKNIEKLDAIRQHYHLSDSEICRKCELTPSSVLRARKDGCDISTKTLHKLAAQFPEISREWLYNGEGEMLSSEPTSSQPTGHQLPSMQSHISREIFTLAQSFADTTAKLTSIQMKMQEQNIKSQEQIDRLISLLEKK